VFGPNAERHSAVGGTARRPSERKDPMSELIAGKVVRLSDRIRRVLAPNPGIMPGTGTNTYLVGQADLAVIDPGPDVPSHVRVILEAGAGKIRWILVTHTHPDHSTAARFLKEETGAKVLGWAARKTEIHDPHYAPDLVLGHHDVVQGVDYTLRAIHTPGHDANHLCYLLEEEKVLFTGDHVMQGSTVVIAPPNGDMQAYLESLELLRTYGAAALAPGHGHMMPDPEGAIRALIRHRLHREAKVVRALKDLPLSTVKDLLPLVYDDVPSFLHPVAEYSLLAHLIKLEREKRGVKEGGRWRLLAPSPETV